MSPDDSATDRAPRVEMNLDAGAASAGLSAGAPPKGAHLKVFGPDVMASQYRLDKTTVTIGRIDSADIILPSRSVSRCHATITWNGAEFVLEDSGSTSGTLVNDVCVDRHVLEHGDSIRICGYVLQFADRTTSSVAEEAAARARLMLRGDYSPLPLVVQARYRMLDADEFGAPSSSETLQMSHNGLLIPAVTPPDENNWLELELATTGNDPRCFIGQIMGAIARGGIHWMCVAIHALPKARHEALVAAGSPGPWISVDSEVC